MSRISRLLFPAACAVVGVLSLATIALRRGEPINALWLVTAALCCYVVGYRFYSAFISAKVLALDSQRATPAERLEDGRDFVPTNKWIVFGHHFAAIAGPGPLVGPVLAAQFGYLPGTLWLILGAVLGGCVQDFTILLFSVRRDGKSLGQIAREEIGRLGGAVAFIAVISITIILLGVVALVVVNALKSSPWGTFTIAMTMPIAILMGLYLRFVRPGKALEASVMGFGLVLAGIWGGQWVSHNPTWAGWFTFSATALAVMVIVYGYAASVLPVWLLLAPRDYLSTFVKLGAIAVLAVGLLAARPTLQMPALTRFVDGTGPVFAGKLFPFAFITVACGAISGFHSLVASGTTPKLITTEMHTRFVGYGAMLAESFVGVMAMVAACVLQPGAYFAINSPAAMIGTSAASAASTVTSWGFPVDAAQLQSLARAVGEQTLLSRTGGAPAFAVGMAQIFAGSLGGQAVMALWYHFAVMFEALFILTIIDAGTRVCRFMLQDALGNIWAPLGRTSWYPSVAFTSGLVVAGWGYFLWQGIKDPLGGINSLWPLFGIANQLLAIVALCVGTTVIIKLGRARFAFVTSVPLAWLASVTFTAAYQKVFSPSPRLGFLAHARQLATAPATRDTARLIVNDRIDAVFTAVLIMLVVLVLLQGIAEWWRVLAGRKVAVVQEAPFVMSRLAREESL